MFKEQPTIYTWGYSGGTPADLALYLAATGAELIDIRYLPRSRQPDWTQRALITRWGDRYHWQQNLGNSNYNRPGPIRLLNAQKGIMGVRSLLTQTSILLLCACRDVTRCHRQVAADVLRQATGAPVVHLPARFAAWQPGPAPAILAPGLWVLSGKDPWWSLIAWREKAIETRSFRPYIPLPARIGLATSATLDPADRERMSRDPAFRQALERHSVMFQPRSARYPHILDPVGLFPPGHLIATALVERAEQVTGVGRDSATGLPRITTVERPEGFLLSEQEFAFGNYSRDRWLWFLAEITVLPQPVPIKGSLGLWVYHGGLPE